MNTLGLISGIFLTAIGLILVGIPLFSKSLAVYVTWIYGIPVLIIGIVIFFNLKKEDQIEQIKHHSKR